VPALSDMRTEAGLAGPPAVCQNGCDPLIKELTMLHLRRLSFRAGDIFQSVGDYDRCPIEARWFAQTGSF